MCNQRLFNHLHIICAFIWQFTCELCNLRYGHFHTNCATREWAIFMWIVQAEIWTFSCVCIVLQEIWWFHVNCATWDMAIFIQIVQPESWPFSCELSNQNSTLFMWFVQPEIWPFSSELCNQRFNHFQHVACLQSVSCAIYRSCKYNSWINPGLQSYIRAICNGVQMQGV